MNMKRIFIAVFTAFVLCSGSQIHAGNYITEYIDATYSSLEIAGSFNVSGASSLASRINTTGLDISISGASSAKIGCDGTIKGVLSGASAIKYKGNAVIDVKVSGRSSVIRN